MEKMITYAHESDPKGARFRQNSSDALPEWAVDVQDEESSGLTCPCCGSEASEFEHTGIIECEECQFMCDIDDFDMLHKAMKSMADLTALREKHEALREAAANLYAKWKHTPDGYLAIVQKDELDALCRAMEE